MAESMLIEERAERSFRGRAERTNERSQMSVESQTLYAASGCARIGRNFGAGMFVLSEMCRAHALTEHDFYDWLSPPTHTHTQTDRRTHKTNTKDTTTATMRARRSHNCTRTKKNAQSQPQCSCVWVNGHVHCLGRIRRAECHGKTRIPAGKWAGTAQFFTDSSWFV